MAVIRKHNKFPDGGYVQIDNDVIANRIKNTHLSEGARLLYCFLVSLRNGATWNDAGVCKHMGIGDKTLKRRKKELKEANLILVDQPSPRNYFLYIGNSVVGASEVKEHWYKFNGGDS